MKHIPLQTKQKKLRYVEFVSNSYMVNHTKVIQCNIRDITERKKAQEKILEMQKELENSLVLEPPNLTSPLKTLQVKRKNGKKQKMKPLKQKSIWRISLIVHRRLFFHSIPTIE